ncbi:MAG TPA: glycosyltransferase [Nitrososphaeraceae archaeon]|nr:glycosyltransferase [Nitrososphaeraceae archaeon]
MPNESTVGISVILPVHNEEKLVEQSLNFLSAYFTERKWDFELILAEDNSTDDTVPIIKRLSLENDRIKLVSIKSRIGKGGAILAATVNFSLKNYVAYMDIDLSAHPSELEKLLGSIDNYDVVIGSRILDSSSVSINRPFYRTLLSHLYSKLFRFLFRIPIRDPQCGLKLFKKDKIRPVFSAITIPDFAFDTDLVVTAFSRNLMIKEVPINWRHVEDSKVRVGREINAMMMDLISIWYNSHLLWLDGQDTYPQKKGSIFGKLLFAILSNNNRMKKRIQENKNRMLLARSKTKEVIFSNI